MAKAQITGAAIVRAIHEESQQTRRGVTADMAATLVNAGGKNDRERVGKMLALLRDEGALRYHEGRWWATEMGLAGAAIREAAEQTTADSDEVPAPACTGCDSQEGEYHNPECPAVNAFQAGRIPAEVCERPDDSKPGECIGFMLDALVAGTNPATLHDQALQTEVVELLDGLIERTHDRITSTLSDAEPLRELLAHCESIRARTMRALFVPADMLGRKESS